MNHTRPSSRPSRAQTGAPSRTQTGAKTGTHQSQTRPRQTLATGCALVLSLIGLIGCGSGSPAAPASLAIASVQSTACSVSSSTPTSSGTAPAITPAATALTIYPGQTLTLPITIAALSSGTSQPVNVGASTLPEGLTVPDVTSQSGATATLTLTASTAVAGSCFTGMVDGLDSVTVPFTITARSATGETDVPIALTVLLENPAFSPSKTDLPVLSLSTTNSAPVTSTDTYVPTTVAIADSTTPANVYSGTGKIKGHGNSTWLMPKKPYKIKLDSKASLLGMKSAKDWILLANYDDKPMLRTALAFHISQVMGMFWTPSAEFAEVYLNGAYQGTYQVSEEVEIDSHRLDIAEISDTADSGDALTGGYLLEIDRPDSETFMTTSPRGVLIGSQDPDPPTSAQEAYLTTTIATAENALYSSTYTSTTTGWPAFFDQDSFINWFLVEELLGNVDADFGSSDFLYKLENDQHLYMGPVWDFDVSAGNTMGVAIASPTVPWVRARALWYQQLFTDPAFLAAVQARWTQVRPQLNDLPTFLSTNAATLQTAQANNYARWPILGVKVWPNPQTAGTYQGEVSTLSTWMTQRLAYMDSVYLVQ